MTVVADMPQQATVGADCLASDVPTVPPVFTQTVLTNIDMVD
jgi:hypothetical protein